MNTTNITKAQKAATSSKNSTKNTSKVSSNNFSNHTTKKYKYSDIFKAASKKYNVPQNLLEAVAMTESSFRTNAKSYCGAMGVMQLMPATAKSLGVDDAYDPVQNIMGGAKYISQLLKKYNGNTSLALAAYNGGSGNVAKYNGVPSFCRSYVNKVLNYAKKGVTVPDKTFNVSSMSKSGILMADYSNNNNSVVSNHNKVASTQKNNTQTKSTSSSTANSISNTSSMTYEELFHYASNKYNVPLNLLKSLALFESNFDSKAISKSGAIGIMQLMPSTAKELGVKNSFDPVENVLGGAKYLSQMLKKYNGNTSLAIAAYNAGQGNVAKYNGIPPFATDFVNKVITKSKNNISVPDITITNTSSNSNNEDNLENLAKELHELFKDESTTSKNRQLALIQNALLQYDTVENFLNALSRLSYNTNNKENFVDMISSIRNYYI